jgi:hypothetical protein
MKMILITFPPLGPDLPMGAQDEVTSSFLDETSLTPLQLDEPEALQHGSYLVFGEKMVGYSVLIALLLHYPGAWFD